MSVQYRKKIITAALSILLGIACVPSAEKEGSIELLVTGNVVGKTMTWLGPSVITGGPTEEVTAKYIRDSGFNTTKYWHYFRDFPAIAARKELYGLDYKEIAIRQVTEEPEKIDWDFELEIQKDQQASEHRLDLCKKYGIQPVVDLLAPHPKYNDFTDGPLVREVYWRRVFLFCYWANKIKKYNFTLWEMGSESNAEGSAIQAEVGSDAAREAEKLTGVKIKIASAGDDYTISDIIAGYEKILRGKAADRLDVLSFHSFNFFSTFPEKSGYPTYLEHVQCFDRIQRWCRPDKPLLPYWDTSWFWRKKRSGEGHQSDHLLAGLQYTSRLIWSNQCGVELSVPFVMYGPESDSLYGRGLGGVIKVKEGTKETRPSKAYYALRMMARATTGGKERLELEGLPGGDKVLALVSRDKEHLYLTFVNRTKDTAYKFHPGLPAAVSGRPYLLREFSEKVNDEVVGEGKLPLKLELEPLSVKQMIVEL
ncbi:MAG: hypothetical protein U9P14_12815 [Gemmatimonadota bacterium]|nr:hypothetical protein [Gemmatimonadota bacterium]